MSPSAEAEVKKIEDTKPSPEECEPDKKRAKEEEEAEPKKPTPKVPDQFFTLDPKKLPPKIKKTKKDYQLKEGLAKRRLARAIEQAARGIPTLNDALLHITQAKNNYWTTKGYTIRIQSDTSELLAKLTPEQLQDPDIGLLSRRIQHIAKLFEVSSEESQAHIQAALSSISEIEALLLSKHRIVEEATDRLFNFGEVNYPDHSTVCFDYFNNQIFIGDTVLANLPDYGLTEAIVVQLGRENFVYITPRRSGRTFCWFGVQVEVLPPTDSE